MAFRRIKELFSKKPVAVQQRAPAKPPVKRKMSEATIREIEASVARAKKTMPMVARAVASKPEFVKACRKANVANTAKAFENAYKILNESNRGKIPEFRKKTNELIADTLWMPEEKALANEAEIVAKSLSLLIEKGHITPKELAK